MMPNMKAKRYEAPGMSIKKWKQGFIIDTGQNLAGWLRLNMRAPKGDTVSIKYAEKARRERLPLHR